MVRVLAPSPARLHAVVSAADTVHAQRYTVPVMQRTLRMSAQASSTLALPQGLSVRRVTAPGRVSVPERSVDWIGLVRKVRNLGSGVGFAFLVD